jgi:hypothetical protein
MKIAKLQLNKIIKEEYAKLKSAGFIKEMSMHNLDDEITSEIYAELETSGPTDAKKLAAIIGRGYTRATEEQVFSAVDVLFDLGTIYFDDDGIVFLLPEHHDELLRTGAY